MNRIAVRYRGIPLMPMKTRRVQKYLDSGKGKIRYDRKLKIHYLQLLEEPSDFNTQDINIGIDPGSSFDGFSVVSNDTHHCNIELVHREKKGKTSIKALKKRQAEKRRGRRSRLRHRRARFDNRTSKKLVPTIKSNVDYRKWLINKLCEMYPITNIIIEDVKFNHYKSKKGSSFSLVEQGKTEFYGWIRNKGLNLETYDGFNTKKLRVNSFGFEPKVKDKGDKLFEAHCIDSFVLACNKDYKINTETGELMMDEPIITNQLHINKKTIFIKKKFKVRRCLTRTRARYKNAKRYYRLKKGGGKEYYTNMSSHRSIVRVKLNDEKSNHPREWKYIDNGYAERVKSATAPYGGTVFDGVKKFFKNGEWINREIS